MAIGQVYKKNFEVLCTAVRNEDTALVECKDAVTGKTVIAICAVSHHEDNVIVTPIAKMIDGNPYEELLPPN